MRPFATGLRNPVGMALNPASGAALDQRQRTRRARLRPRARLYDQRPDGGFYGWPWLYYGDRRRPARPARRRADAPSSPTTRSARTPLRSASPSRRTARARSLPSTARGTASRVGLQGDLRSLRRRPPSGPPQALVRRLSVDDDARGRPVGIEFDRSGAFWRGRCRHIVWRDGVGGVRFLARLRRAFGQGTAA